MSNSDNALQSAMDSYMFQNNRKPNATQLSKFTGCKYARASRFLRDNKSSSQKKSKKKSKKNRPCKKYQLDMLGATFGACTCGFSRADHYISDDSDVSDDNDDSDDSENENYKLKQEIKKLQQQFENKEKQMYVLNQKYAKFSEEKARVMKQNSDLNKKLNKLEKDNSSLKKEISSKDTKLRETTMNIISSKDEYNLLLAQVASLKEKNNNVKQRNENNGTENNSLVKQNKKLKAENKAFVNRYNNMCSEKDHTNKILAQKNKELTKQNCDLNEECKELKLELKDIKDKYNKIVLQNISDYKTWDYQVIINWIVALDHEFIRYEATLRKTLKEEEITGEDLIDLDKNDLNRFGIKVFKHKKRIMKEIQNLTMQSQNNMMNDNNNRKKNIIAFNEGNKETEYIPK